MELKQLQSFVAAVQHQSFTKAAEHLFLSQPTISAHIRQLEDELGKRLILRTTKSIEITPLGQEIYEYALSILTLRDRICEVCKQQTQKIIHLGASTIPSSYILPDVLPEFGVRFPDTYFAIHQSDSLGIVNGLKEGLFDVGMVGMEIEDDSIECVPFCRDHMVLITPVNEHFLALHRQQISVRELLREPIIMREKGSGSKKVADRFLEHMGLSDSDLNIVARINDQEAIKKLVAGGLGVSIISEMAAKNYLCEKRILGFPLVSDVSSRNLYFIYRKNFVLKAHIQKFIRYVTEKYQPQH